MSQRYRFINFQNCVLSFLLTITCVTILHKPIYDPTRKLQSQNFLQSRIVGGGDSPAGEYPWFGLLTLKGERWCGSSLISPSVVLSAAHCFYGEDDTQDVSPVSLRVLIGAYSEPFTGLYGNGGIQLEDFGVKDIIVHPDFNATSWKNDFALVFLDTINGVAKANPVPLDWDGISERYIGELKRAFISYYLLLFYAFLFMRGIL